MKSKATIGLFLFCLAVVGTIQVFFSTGGSWHSQGTGLGNYFGLLADGFLSGHLHLSVEPDPRLASEPTPVTPDRLDALRVQGVFYLPDASLYKGHYYLDWGPVPALLHAGWQLVSGGHRLPISVAEVIAGLIIYASFTFLAYRLRSRCNKAPAALVWMCSLAIGVGAITLNMVSRPVVYNEAIMDGAAFLSLAWCPLLLAWEESRRRYLLLVLAGVLMGCAMGARITLLAYAASTGAVILVVDLAKKHRTTRLVGDLLSYGTPVVIAGLLLGVYNAARFGSFFDVGMGFSLVGVPWIPQGSFNHVIRDVVLYLLAVPQLGIGYPWFNMVGPIVPHFLPPGAPEPAGLPLLFPSQSISGKELIEPPLISPFLLAPTAIFSFAIALMRRMPVALRLLLLSMLVGVPIPLLLFPLLQVLVLRYYTDIALPLAFAGSLTLIYWAHDSVLRRGNCRIVAAGGTVACSVSIVMGLMLGFAMWTYSFPDAARNTQITWYQALHRLGVPDHPPVKKMPPYAQIADYAKSVGISPTCAMAYLAAHDYDYPTSIQDLSDFKTLAPAEALCG